MVQLLNEGSSRTVQERGGVYESPISGQTFNKIAAQFTIPSPTALSNAAGTYAASAWVGIDVYATRWGSSTHVSFDACGFSVSAGSVIQLTVTATSLSVGTAVIENLTTGKTVTKSLTALSSSSHLSGENAERIVEDFESGNSLMPFAKFGIALFNGVSTSSHTQSTSGATTVKIQNSPGQVITDTTIPSSSEVQVKYM